MIILKNKKINFPFKNTHFLVQYTNRKFKKRDYKKRRISKRYINFREDNREHIR